MDELLGSLKSHEDRLKQYDEYGAMENAFYTQLQLSKGNSRNNESSNCKNNVELSRQRGRGGYSCRDKQGVKGDGHLSDQYQNQKEGERVGEPRKFQCYYCNKFGHIEKYCRLKEKHAKFVEQEPNNESETLFMACYTATMCSLKV